MTTIRTLTLLPRIFFKREIEVLFSECEKYYLSVKNGVLIATFVPAITVLYFLFIAFPGSRDFAVTIVQENYPVELATFLLFLVSSFFAVYNAYCYWSMQNLVITSSIYFAMSAFLFLIAMEEIAWGQQLFSFSTPNIIKAYNAQEELTIHNLRGIHGNAAKLYILLCAAGVAGIFLRADGYCRVVFQAIQTPRILLPSLAVVLLASLPKLYTEHFYVHHYYEYYIRWTTEVIELAIGFLALFYMILKRKFAAGQHATVASSESP